MADQQDLWQIEANETGRVTIPIESYFAGDYRLEYDGKYVTLFGKDNTLEIMQYGSKGDGKVEYEEMVLIPCVVEKRNITPTIESVTDTYIIIKL